MNTKTLAITVALASLGAAAHAQSLTVTSSVIGNAPAFTYTYTVMPSFDTNQLIFNFSDANLTYSTSNGPLAMQASGTLPNVGVYTFGGGTLAANSSETFKFSSPDAPGGILGTVGLQYSTAAVAAVNGVTPAPLAAAPEPGGLTALAVLGGCLALGITAKRRRATMSSL